MLFQDSRRKRRENYPIMRKPDSNSQRGIAKLSKSWIGRLIPRMSIGKKISYGYSLAIGIGVFGTSVGLIIGDYYQKQATVQLKLVNEQQKNLRDLEKTVVAVRSHPQRLLPVLGKSILFEYESSKFLAEVTQFKTQLSELESFIYSHPSELAVNAEEFKDLLKGYETNIESYTQLIKFLWEKTDPANLQLEQISGARQQVFVVTSGERAIKIDFRFERLFESLNRVIAASETQEMQANAAFNRAEALRLQIIVASMLLSAAIAAVLALITSRAIARPLEAVTQVATAIVQEANFDLQATVTTEDEVGTLATSLNKLVQWVGEYTHELELARQTLEQRVDERTEELTSALQRIQRTQAQLIQSEKMSSLGQMVAGVAHEINNPVNFIHGNLTYIGDYTEQLLSLIALYQQCYPYPDPKIQDRLELIDLDFLANDLPKVLSSMKMGTDRIRQIVLSLRNFSRLDEADMKQVNIHEGIDNTLLILNNRLKQGIEVVKNYGDLPPVACYPAQLNQVFMNILANAIDALQEVKDKTECCSLSPTITIETQKLDSQQIQVTISDNGPGIPPDIQGKLFDPFFTTKPVGQGTGLGLSICYQIVEKHKGKIEVISQLGQGTKFVLLLAAH